MANNFQRKKKEGSEINSHYLATLNYFWRACGHDRAARLFFYQLERDGISYLIKTVIYVVIGIGGGMFLYFVFNRVLPYHNRAYSLDDNVLTIAKGKKQKYFSWNDFEYFYPYSRRYGAPVNYKISHPI